MCSVVSREGGGHSWQSEKSDLVVDVFGEVGYYSSALADQIEAVKALVDTPDLFVRQGSTK